MRKFSPTEFDYDPLNEHVAELIANELYLSEDYSFFRMHALHYFSMMGAMMRVKLRWPGGREDQLGNYTINLAPSGYGKGVSESILENEICNRFRNRFFENTWPTQVQLQTERLAQQKASVDSIDYETALKQVENDFSNAGKLYYTFEKPSESALKQGKTLLQMARMGSLNLVTDEIATNLLKSRDAVDNFLTLYDGKLQNNYIKHTKDQQRADQYFGKIVATMLLFGLSDTLLEDDATREAFMHMLRHGYARRLVCAYVDTSKTNVPLMSSEDQIKRMENRSGSAQLSTLSQQFEALADISTAPLTLNLTRDAAKLIIDFDNYSIMEGRALMRNNPFPSTELKLLNYELQNRRQKLARIAATYAFVNQAPEVDVTHVQSAIRILFDSYDAFRRMVHVDEPHVQLANYIAALDREVTQPHLIEHIPSFRKARVADRENMLTQAVAWGYTNNVLIKRRVTDSVEFIKGEQLKPTDLSKVLISHSTDITENYQTQTIAFDRLHSMTSTPGIHWLNHELEYGYEGKGYRHDDNIVPGFNLLVIDVDNGVPIQTAQRLLYGYKAMYYLTKSHKPDSHRYRIILPTNYQLELSKDDFAEFMKNLFAWLPFKTDEQTGQRSRKWLSGLAGDTAYQYTDGQLFDVLPLIPKTTRNDDYQSRQVQFKDLDSLQRWFALNTFIGVRNHCMFRYAMVLVDMGMGVKQIHNEVLALNSQIADPLSELEVNDTVMKGVHKRVQAYAATP